MAEVISLDSDFLNEQIQKMESACSYFEGTSEGVFASNLAALGGMNSDFVEELSKAIELIQYKNLKDVSEAMRKYVAAVQEVNDALVDTDNKIAEHNKLLFPSATEQPKTGVDLLKEYAK